MTALTFDQLGLDAALAGYPVPGLLDPRHPLLHRLPQKALQPLLKLTGCSLEMKLIPNGPTFPSVFI